jgi:hypothetical protein
VGAVPTSPYWLGVIFVKYAMVYIAVISGLNIITMLVGEVTTESTL